MASDRFRRPSRPPSPASPARESAFLPAAGPIPACTPWDKSSAFDSIPGCAAEILLRALNAVLPRDIAVLDAAETHDGFHPTHKALRKRYRYLIHDGPVRDVFRRGYCWHFNQGRLDDEAMQRAGSPRLSARTISAASKPPARAKNSVRTIFDLSVRRGSGNEQDCIAIEVASRRFFV